MNTVFSEDDSGTTSFYIGGGYVWYIKPDVRGKENYNLLMRYDISGNSYKTILEHNGTLHICMLTDKRIYVNQSDADDKLSTYSNNTDVFSVDYDGKNRRDESKYFASASLLQNTFFLARVRLEGLFSTPYYMYHDLLSGEEYYLPTNDSAISIGYNEMDGRIYYITSQNADAVFTPLIYYKRAEELGISYQELLKDETEIKVLEEKIEKAYFEDKMYLKSCNIDGSDVKTVFEYPEGAFFDAHKTNYNINGEESRAYFSTNSRTGCVSEDGKWYYFTEITRGDNGGKNKREARINLETGDVEYPG